MSGSKFEDAMTALQNPTDPAALLKALLFVRKEVDWAKNKDNIARLRERGCLKQVTAVLANSAHKNSIDVALSILGNCLMDRGCTREVVAQHNIMSVINQLLKKYPKEDSINGRAFRIIGNMCQHRDLWANIIIDRKPHMVTHIVELVRRTSKEDMPPDEKISEATIITALRALRELLNCQTVMPLVKNFGALKAVGALFIKYSIEWQETKKNEKMLIDIVRVIQEYSRYRYYHSILEMRNTERGDSLIHLSNVLVLAPRRIVKIVMNFIRSCQLKSELPIPEICNRFIEVLEKHSIVQEFDGECMEYLQCLCYLLDHPANRNTERCGRTIPLLIKVLKEFEVPSNNVFECCILLVTTLNKFKYDDGLMLNQLKHGIIQGLIEKLNWLVGSSKQLNLKHASEKKRKYIFGPSSPVTGKRKIQGDLLKEVKLSPSSSDDELDFFLFAKPNRSPSPCSSSDGESLNALSWGSPSSSPNHSLINEAADSDSDNYSPVCSEADDRDFPLIFSQDQIDEEVDPLPPLMDLDDSRETDDDLHQESPSSENSTIMLSLKVGLRLEILRLLKSYVKLSPPVPHLANEELLFALLKCSLTDCPDTLGVISSILDSHEYLIPLMQTEFIQTLYDMTEVEHSQWCTKCAQYLDLGQKILKKFTCLAESGVGKGDIAHQLLRGDKCIKEHLVLTIPYIVKNRSVLSKLMLNCGGLEILMKLMREKTELNYRSIKVLCAMASRKLSIANPKQLTSSLTRPKIVADKYKPPDSCPNVVSFLLDDGNVVKADRQFLIEKSDFFNGLLNGHFKESSESRIALPNVECKSLRCLLHLLATLDKNETMEVDLELESLLDVILLCDRYLLVELCVALTDNVEQFRISTETVPLIYNWSVESGTNLLRVESVAFALVANVNDSERFSMFESLFTLGYKEQLAEDIQNLLVRYLTLNDYNQRVKDLYNKKKHLKLHLGREEVGGTVLNSHYPLY